MTSLRQRRLEYVLLICLVGLFVSRSLIPAWRTLNTDFRNYYVAAWLFRNKVSMLRVYDFTWFQRQKDHAGVGQGIVGFVPDTLVSALPIVPFAGLAPLSAKRCWIVINAALLALSIFLLTGVTRLGWRRVTILTFFAVEPLSTSFLYGQMHLAVFFFLVLAVWLLERSRAFAAGMSVALAAALKLYPALFVVFFARKKQWRALAATLLGLLVLGGISIALFGWDVHVIYLREILPAIGRGENIDPYAAQWNSLTALLHRAFIIEPELNPHPLIQLPALYAILQPLTQALIFVPAVWLLTPGDGDSGQRRLEWAMFIAMLIALSTGPTPYHLCVLILAATLAVDSLRAAGRRREAITVAILYTLCCLPWPRQLFLHPDGWRMLLASPRLYPTLALPVFLYAAINSGFPFRMRIKAHRLEAQAFAVGFIVVALAGSLQAFRHQAGMFDHYRHRFAAPDGVLLEGEPAIAARGIYFTRMPGGRPDFATVRRQGIQTESVFDAEDEFHPSATHLTSDVWIEAAGQDSRIIRVSPSETTAAANVEALNAEEPTVSPDGEWLAFIREKRGRGELWVKPLARFAHQNSADEREVASDHMDVWEATFAPGDQEIVFTAAPQGEPELFSLDRSSLRITPLPLPGPARYPAISPDGDWLAFSHFERGEWRLELWNPRTQQLRRIVGGDCNSISPAWSADGRELIYASDCGRGLEMTALEHVAISP